jgi:hypothetical protein
MHQPHAFVGGPFPVQEKYFFPGTGCSDFRPRPVDGAGIEKMVNDFHEIALHLGIELQSASFGVQGVNGVSPPAGSRIVHRRAVSPTNS